MVPRGVYGERNVMRSDGTSACSQKIGENEINHREIRKIREISHRKIKRSARQ